MMSSGAATTVSEAVETRRSIRRFLPQSVPEEVMRRVIEKARRAPSGGNLQPWHLVVLTGEPLREFCEALVARALAEPRGDGLEYQILPINPTEPYKSRRSKIAEDMYAKLEIPREDRIARRAWFAENYRFFGAPVGLLCFIDRQMGHGQFSDLGMFLQNVALLLREEGLDSCFQEAWANFSTTIYDHLDIDRRLMLFAGMAIGVRDPAEKVNHLVSDRAATGDFADFRGFEQAKAAPSA